MGRSFQEFSCLRIDIYFNHVLNFGDEVHEAIYFFDYLFARDDLDSTITGSFLQKNHRFCFLSWYSHTSMLFLDYGVKVVESRCRSFPFSTIITWSSANETVSRRNSPSIVRNSSGFPMLSLMFVDIEYYTWCWGSPVYSLILWTLTPTVYLLFVYAYCIFVHGF